MMVAIDGASDHEKSDRVRVSALCTVEKMCRYDHNPRNRAKSLAGYLCELLDGDREA